MVGVPSACGAVAKRMRVGAPVRIAMRREWDSILTAKESGVSEARMSVSGMSELSPQKARLV